ncbi:hypothetical protein IMSHALPRED_008768 [Imshaugia aleurites]|uniref:Uncharacterized protein n=1 Tax=Imshaugia aleurites TaxID=172621 RepID=A0A8H3ITX2_9LECA|nr:hypothetical protein IMSHALPRED_008768 [Imshaugia aleurites]
MTLGDGLSVDMEGVDCSGPLAFGGDEDEDENGVVSACGIENLDELRNWGVRGSAEAALSQDVEAIEVEVEDEEGILGIWVDNGSRKERSLTSGRRVARGIGNE